MSTFLLANLYCTVPYFVMEKFILSFGVGNGKMQKGEFRTQTFINENFVTAQILVIEFTNIIPSRRIHNVFQVVAVYDSCMSKFPIDEFADNPTFFNFSTSRLNITRGRVLVVNLRFG